MTTTRETHSTHLTKKGKCIALWVQNANCIVDVKMETTTTATHEGVSEKFGARFLQRNQKV